MHKYNAKLHIFMRNSKYYVFIITFITKLVNTTLPWHESKNIFIHYDLPLQMEPHPKV